MTTNNFDPAELAKFSELAHQWWNPSGDFKPLHDINPLRLDYIDRRVGLSGKAVIDIGCGGGILAESMAVCGARVTGIDLAEVGPKMLRCEPKMRLHRLRNSSGATCTPTS